MRPNLRDLISGMAVEPEEKKEEPKQPSFVASSSVASAMSGEIPNAIREYESIKDEYYKAIEQDQIRQAEQERMSDISNGKIITKGAWNTVVNLNYSLQQMVFGTPDALKDLGNNLISLVNISPENIADLAFQTYWNFVKMTPEEETEFKAKKAALTGMIAAVTPKSIGESIGFAGSQFEKSMKQDLPIGLRDEQQRIADIQARFNAREYEPTPIKSMYDESIWGDESKSVIDKLADGINWNAFDIRDKESRIYLLNSMPNGIASLGASIGEMLLFKRAFGLAGIPEQATTKAIAVLGSVGEGAMIANDVYNDIRERKMEEIFQDQWKNASEQVFKQAVENAKAQGENDKYAEQMGEEAKRALIDQWVSSNPGLRTVVEDAALRGKNLAVTINLLTTATEYIQAATIVKNFSRLGAKIGFNAAEETIEGGTRNILAKPFWFGNANMFKAKPFLKNLGTGLENFASEALEEGGINAAAERFGTELALGNDYRWGDFMGDLRSGMYVEDTFWGGVFGHGSYHGGSAINNIKNSLYYKSRKEAYEAQQKVLEEWDKIGKAANKDILGELVDVTNSVHSILNLDAAKKRALDAGDMQLAEAIENRKISVQAHKAFKTGTTEQLLSAYQMIAEKSEDAKIRENATLAIKEVKELEKIYNDVTSKGYLNNTDVFMTRAMIHQNNKNLALTKLVTQQLQATAEQALLNLQKKGKFDASFSITEDGINYTGNQAKEFQEAARELEEVNALGNALGAQQKIGYATDDANKHLSKITSKSYQENIRKANEVVKQIKDNKKLLEKETKEEFMNEIELLMTKGKLNTEAKEQIREIFSKKYDIYDILKKKVESETAKEKTPDTKRPKKGIKGIVERFKNRQEGKKLKANQYSTEKPSKEEAKKEPIEDLLPAELNEELDDASKAGIKENMRKLIFQAGHGATLEDIIQNSLNEIHEGETAEQVKAEVEKLFNTYVLAWKLNGKEISNEESLKIYKKFFGVSSRLSVKLAEAVLKKEETQQKIQEEIKQEVVQPEQIVIETPSETVRPVVAPVRKGVPTTAFFPTDDLIAGKPNNDIISYRLADPTRNNPGDKVTVVPYTDADKKGRYDGNIRFPRKNWNKGQIKTFWNDKFRARTSDQVEGTSTTSAFTSVNTSKSDKITFTEKHVGIDERVHYKTYDHTGGDINEKINDNFIFKNDDDHNKLNSDQISHVNLHVINFVNNEQRESTVDITIVYKDGTTENMNGVPVYNDHDNYQPMLVKDEDGENICMIDYPYKTTDRSENLRIAEFRRKVIMNGKYETAIVKKVPDLQAGRESGFEIAPTPVSENCPTAILAVFSKGQLRDGESAFENGKRVISNKSEITPSEGNTYDLRFHGYDEQGRPMYTAHPITAPKQLSPEAFNTAIWVLKAYLSKYDNSGFLNSVITPEKRDAIISFFKKNFKVDITSSTASEGKKSGIHEILSMFINVGSEATREITNGLDGQITAERFRNYLATQEAGKPVLLASGSVFFFGIASGQTKKVINNDGVEVEEYVDQPVGGKNYLIITPGNIQDGLSKDAADKILTMLSILTEKGSNLKTSNNIVMAGNEMAMPVIDNQGNPTTKGTYAEWLKTVMTTTTRSVKMKGKNGEDVYVSRFKPFLELDDNYTPSEKPTQRLAPIQIEKPVTQPAAETQTEIQTEQFQEKKSPDEVELIREIKNITKELGISDLNSLISEEFDNLPMSQEDAMERRVEPVKGVNPQQLTELIGYLFNSVVREHKNKAFTLAEIRSYTNDLFEKYILPTKNKYLASVDKIKAFMDAHPDKQGEYAYILVSIQDRLKVYDSIEKDFDEIKSRVVTVLSKYSSINEETGEQESEEESKVFSQESYEKSPKDSISADLRRFFAGIPKVDNNGTVYGFLGLETYVNFNEAFDKVSSILGAAPVASMGFEDAIRILGEYKNSVPWMEGFISKIKDSNEDMKNKFLYNCINHNLSMIFLMYYWENNKMVTRVYNTNSSELSSIVKKDWESNFMRNHDLVTYDKSIDENVINKAQAKKLVDEFNSWKDKKPDNKTLKAWLEQVGINVDDKTLNEIRERGLTVSGRVLYFEDMFAEKVAAGLFTGIANKLKKQSEEERTVIDEKGKAIPFADISNTIKELAKVEAKFSNKIVTTTFRDGDKSISGLVPLRNASDRIQAIKWDEETRSNLLKDPFSANSMLLNLIGRSTDVRDAVYVKQIGVTAEKKRGESSNGTGITELAMEDQEFVQLGMFWDIRQGEVPVSYWTNNNKSTSIKLRMANMFFPVMSDKSQMLTMYLPVLALNSAHISTVNEKTEIHSDVIAILFEQLFQPEMGRILENARRLNSGGESNCVGYDTGAQMFHMISDFNNVTINVKGKDIKLIKLMNQNPDVYNEQWILQQWNTPDSELRKNVEATILNTIEEEVKHKLEDWENTGITQAGAMKKVSGEYLDKTGFTEATHAATDFVINNLIAISNVFQLVAGDIAFYSQDKLFTEFGFDETIVKGFPELEKVNRYSDLIKTLDSEYAKGNLTEDQYKDIKKKAKPLAYEAPSKDVYRNLSEALGTNLGKRLALLLTPGKRLATSKNDSYLQIFLNDVKQPASNFGFLIKTFYGKDALTDEVKELIANRNIKAIAKMFPKVAAFESIETTDGQEYTTLVEHIDILWGKGKLKKEFYKEVRDKAVSQMTDGLNDDNRLTDEQFQLILQPIKPVTTGSITDRNERQRSVYIKSSAFPLSAQITEGSELDNLRKVMEQTQIQEGRSVRACYKSAAKVGATVTGVNIYDADLSVAKMVESSIIIPRDNFKIQQDVPVHFLHEREDKILIGTQLMKLLFGDGVTDLQIEFEGKPVSGRDLLKTYNDTFKDIVDIVKADLYKELGLDKNGIPVNQEDFMRSISKIIKKEAKARGYSQQSIDALDIVADIDASGLITTFKFMSPLWSSPDSVRYESLLNSIITKRLIKLKLPGYSYVIGSQTGFEKKATMEDVNQSDIIYTKHFDGHSIKALDENGNAQVFLPSRFRDSNGNLINLFAKNEQGYIYIEKDSQNNWRLKDGMIADELLNIPTFRIPTSSHVSSAFVTIAGFLPSNVGDLMIVPKELITQKGIDFDIDKEYGYHLWHHVHEDGRVTPIEELTTLETLDDFISTGQEWYSGIKKAVAKDAQMLARIDEMEEENATLEEIGEEEQYSIEEIMEEYDEFLHKKSEYTMQDIQDAIKKLRFARGLKRKLLENRIIRIHNAVIGSKNPEIQRKVNSTLSMDFARGQANMLQAKDQSFTTILSDRYQRKKMNLGSAGKMGIGVYSNFVTLNSLVQQMEDPLQLVIKREDEPVVPMKFRIGNFTFNGNLGRYISIPSNDQLAGLLTLTDDADTKKRIEDGRISLTELRQLAEKANITNIDQLLGGIRSITEIFAERQNTATDNEKEQIMGRCFINDQTINVDCLLSLMGFDKGDMITDINGNIKETSISYLLLSQPVIKEYIQEIKKSRSSIGDYVNEDAIQQKIFEKYKVEEGTPVAKLDTQTMYDNIFGKQTNAAQLAAFNLYLNLNGMSYQLTDIQRTLGITGGGPNAGLGKSIFNLNAKFDDISKLPWKESTGISLKNAEKLLGDFIEVVDDEGRILKSSDEVARLLEQGYMQFDNYLVKPTTLAGHLITNGIKMGHDTWNQFFPFESPVINQVMKEIMRMQKRSTANWKESDPKSIELKRKIMQEIQKLLFSNPQYGVINGNPVSERRRLFKDLEGKPSLASYLQKLIADKNPEIMSNDLFGKGRMSFDIQPNKQGEISRIIFDHTTQNDFDEEFLHIAFYSLWRNNNPLPDNPAFNPDLDYAEHDITFGENSRELIKAGKKRLDIKENAVDGFEVGVTKLQVIDGERFKITYLGNIERGDLAVDNLNSELGKTQLNPVENSFAQGQPKHVYKIEPVYTTKQLAKDLIAYSYLSGGIQGAIEFVKFVPMIFLESCEMLPKMRKIDLSDPAVFTSELGASPDRLSRMAVQYYQHHPEELPNIKITDINLGDLTLDKIGSFPVPLNNEGQPKYTAKMVAVAYPGKYKEFAVFMLSGDKYYRVHTLGTHGMSEYNILEYNATSIMENFKPKDMSPMPQESKRLTPPTKNTFGVEEGNAKEVLERIAKEGNEYEKKLATQLLKFDGFDVKITIEDINTLGAYRYNLEGDLHNVIISTKVLSDKNKPSVARIFLHEYVHSLTSRELKRYISDDGQLINPENTPEYIVNLNKLLIEARAKLGISNEELNRVRLKATTKEGLTEQEYLIYSLTNIREFAAQVMSDGSKTGVVVDALSKIKYKDSEMTLIDRFIQIVSELLKSLNVDVDDNLLKRSQAVVMELIASETAPAKDEGIQELEESEEDFGVPPDEDEPFTDLGTQLPKKYHVTDQVQGENVSVLDFFHDSTPNFKYRVAVLNTGKISMHKLNLGSGSRQFSGMEQAEVDALTGGSIRDFVIREFGEDAWMKLKPSKMAEKPSSTSGFQGYRGGFENKGKGTPEGDGKDKAMRQIADSFIGEVANESSSSYTSAVEIGDQSGVTPLKQGVTTFAMSGDVNVIMLARNSEFKNKPLDNITKQRILSQHQKGAEFVVGDMPGVDSQFIEYLQEIGAKFTIYHTGTESRIKIEQSQKSKLDILSTSKSVKIEYTNNAGETSVRTISNIRIAENEKVLTAFDDRRNEDRMFTIDKIKIISSEEQSKPATTPEVTKEQTIEEIAYQAAKDYYADTFLEYDPKLEGFEKWLADPKAGKRFYEQALIDLRKQRDKYSKKNNQSSATEDNDINFVFEKHPELSVIGTKQQYSEYLRTIFPESEVQDIVYHGTPDYIEEFDNSKSKVSNVLYFSTDLEEADHYRKSKRHSIIWNTGIFEYNGFRYAQIYDKETKEYYYLKKDVSISTEKLTPKEAKSKYGITKEEFDKVVSDVMSGGNVISAKLNITNLYNGVGEDLFFGGKGYFEENGYDGFITNDDGGRPTIIAAFNPNQIHILGSKKDIEGFKNFMSNKSTEETEKIDTEIALNPSNPTTNGKTLQGEQVEAAAKAQAWLEKVKAKQAEIKEKRPPALTDDEIVNNFMFLLSGKGGTGKTFTTEVILKDEAISVYAAPTHQAKNVLTENLDKRQAVTLQSLLGIKPKKKKQNDKEDEGKRGMKFYGLTMEALRDKYMQGDKIPFFDNDFIVIDEASQLGFGMLNTPDKIDQWNTEQRRNVEVNAHPNPPLGTYLLELIKLKYELTGRLTTVYMMGDIVQTVPIGTTKHQISELLEKVIAGGNTAILEKVRRVDDLDILSYNDQFRNAFFDIYNSSEREAIRPPLRTMLLSGNFNSENLKRLENPDQIISTFIKHYNENIQSETPDPNHTVVINYNKASNPVTIKLTQDIRTRLFGEEGAEKLMNDNELILHEGSFKYKYNNEEFSVENDEKLIVRSYQPGKQKIVLASKKEVVVDVIIATVSIHNPKHGLITINVPYADMKAIKREINKHWTEYNARKTDFTQTLTTRFAGLTYDEINDVQEKLNTFSYGYVINNFKIQGSGITYPIVHAENILESLKTEDGCSLHTTTYLYTALSRVRKKMYIYITGPAPKTAGQPIDTQINQRSIEDIMGNTASIENMEDFLLDNVTKAFSHEFEQKRCNL